MAIEIDDLPMKHGGIFPSEFSKNDSDPDMNVQQVQQSFQTFYHPEFQVIRLLAMGKSWQRVVKPCKFRSKLTHLDLVATFFRGDKSSLPGKS